MSTTGRDGSIATVTLRALVLFDRENDQSQCQQRVVATLMRRMGIEALYRKPDTSRRNRAHRIYPYLLRGLNVTAPNQVWAKSAAI